MTIKQAPPAHQRKRHAVILVCFGMLQLFQSILQPLQFPIREIPSLDDINNSLHHVLADIIG